MIMAQLYVVQSADFLFLQRQTQMTPGNLSAHLSKLENAGYVEITKEFIERKGIRHSHSQKKDGPPLTDIEELSNRLRRGSQSRVDILKNPSSEKGHG
jgi:DNA-binding transcriptional ArsR family regulator